MATTRIFKSGNSLAVRIPKEFAIAREGIEVEIAQEGDALVIRPRPASSMEDLVSFLERHATPPMLHALERPEWPAHRPLGSARRVVREDPDPFE